jgi:TolA-binding protein
MRPFVTSVLALLAVSCASSSGGQAEGVVLAPQSPASSPASGQPPVPEPAASGSAPVPAAVPLAQALRGRLVEASAGSSDPDALLYRQAREHELAGDYTGARKALYELIQKQPSSPFVPYAYLGFADLFFEEAEKDPSKWPLAQRAFMEVVKYPPPANQAYAYAWHRLGLVFARSGNQAQALAAQKKALGATTQYPSLPLARETGAEARRTLVEAYAAAGQPNQAFVFFRAIDAATAPALVVLLGQEYARRGDGQALLALYDDVLPRSSDANVCAGAAAAARAISSRDAQVAAEIERKRTARCGSP